MNPCCVEESKRLRCSCDCGYVLCIFGFFDTILNGVGLRRQGAAWIDGIPAFSTVLRLENGYIIDALVMHISHVELRNLCTYIITLLIAFLPHWTFMVRTIFL